MAVVYYPKQSIVLKRDTISSSFEQVVLNTSPNTILYFGSNSISEISASTIYITSSNALTASYLLGFIESASFAQFSLSASWAPSFQSEGSLSSSWASSSVSASYSTIALNSINGSVSASYALSASYAPFVQTNTISSSWASSSLSSSWSPTRNFLQTGSFYPITTSISIVSITSNTSDYSLDSLYSHTASHCITSSYANVSLSASYAPVQSVNGIVLTTGSFYPISASWSLSSSNSSQLDGQLSNYYLNNSSTSQLKSGSLTIGTVVNSYISIGNINLNHPFIIQKPFISAENNFLRHHTSNRWFWSTDTNQWSSSNNSNSDFYAIDNTSTGLSVKYGNLNVDSRSLTTSSYNGYEIFNINTAGITLRSGSFVGSASYSNKSNISETSTFASQSQWTISSSWASSSISASYAPVSPSISSSYALSASYAPFNQTYQTNTISSSWASSSLSSSYVYYAVQKSRVVSQSFANPLTTNALLGDHFRVRVDSNFVLQNPTNGIDSQKLTWELLQDVTGTRTITYDNKFSFGSDLTSSYVQLNGTGSKRDFMSAIYNSVEDKWYVVAFAKGY